MKNGPDLELRIKEIGREIYPLMSGVPPVFNTKSWMGRLMEWTMKDDDFRVRLFRFVDVLPSLKTDALVVKLLQEYLGGDTPAPLLVRGAINRIPRKGFLPHAAATAVRAGVESMARHFIAGKNPEEAMAALGDLRKGSSSFSIDLLGEVVVSEREAQEYASRYIDLMDFAGSRFGGSSGQAPGSDISLKVSSFYSQLDPLNWDDSVNKTKDALRPLFRKARQRDISLTLDMEHYYYKDLILAVLKGILEEREFSQGPGAAIALQAYLKDTEGDLRGLISWSREKKRRIGVRLVKGAYWDYEIVVNRRKGWPLPVFLDKAETDRNFEALTRLLLNNADTVHPAIATHNLRSISHALAAAESMGIARDAVEFQVLFGMAEPVRKALEKLGCMVRVYAPVGELIPGMAYLVRRLLENTSNESFLRKSFSEGTEFEEMISPPPAPRRTKKKPEARAGQFENEPALDFSMAGNREKMAAALKQVRKDFDRRYPLLIGGEEVWTDSEVVSRNTAEPGEVIGRVSSAGRTEAERAVQEALKASASWSRTDIDQRAGYLKTAAEEIRKRRFELAALEILEVGKTWGDADGDVTEAIDYLLYYGREMLRLGNPRNLGAYPGEDNEYNYLPRGIGVVISPWNFPLAIATGMVSAAVVTGNCVIFKPSGLSPVIGQKLVEVFTAAGLPPGVLQFLPGPGADIGEYLVAHPEVDFIAFTGSKDVGLRIVRLAGETSGRSIKKVIAEMGGKNAVIIDETADLDEAVKGVLESAFGYQGQKCSACSRVILVGAVYEDFLERFKEAVMSIKIGPAEDPGSFMGPVIDEGALKKIMDNLEIGKGEARVVLAREARGKGSLIGPVVFGEVDPQTRIAQEEIFGPVVSLFKARDIDHALDIANGTAYALTGGLFSRSPSVIRTVKERFMVGNLYVNRKITGALVGRQPFGGFGMSGVGSKAGGPDYLLQFMNPRSISENTMRRGFAPL